MASVLRRQTDLPSHVVQFAVFLRQHEFEIGPREELDFLRAFSKNTPSSFEAQEALFKAVFVKNRKEFLRFDDLYASYWNRLSLAEDSQTKPDKPHQAKGKDSPLPSLRALKNWLHGGRIEETEETAAYSAFEVLAKKDFSGFSNHDHKELRAIIRLLARRLATAYNRRFIRSKKRIKLDLKNTIRDSMKRGGDIRDFKYHQRKKKKVNLFLICDVSKSMELYSKFFIEFMYNFQQIDHTLKTFVFSSELIHITRLLNDGDFDRVLENLSDEVPQWSGGTRIGESLSQFISGYSTLLNKAAVVIIVSDGWDIGDLGILGESMDAIQRKCEKIIWLNPLAGNPEYQPSTKGMLTCLPYVDVFLPLYNLESLKNFAAHV